MNRGARYGIFGAGAAGLGALLAWAIAGLPTFGEAQSTYADIVVPASAALRHVTSTVGALTFDFRGIDTLGEELILLAAVVAVAVILRTLAAPEEHEFVPRPARLPDLQPTEAMRAFGVALIGAAALMGLGLAGHGQITPGGGFQGGVVLATSVFVAYLIGGLQHLDSTFAEPVCEPAESVGAGVYLAMGIVGLVVGTAFLENVLPFGTTGTITSGGTLPVLNVAVALEVAAGIILVLHHYARSAELVRKDGRP